MSQTHVSGKRMLEKYEIEYNGQVFNCLQCLQNQNDNCCGTNDQNYTNKIACQKCRCQQLYPVLDGSRSGNQPVGDLGCKNCSMNMSQAECNSYNFLNNKDIQHINVIECKNNVCNIKKESNSGLKLFDFDFSFARIGIIIGIISMILVMLYIKYDFNRNISNEVFSLL